MKTDGSAWLPRVVRARLDPAHRYGLRLTLFALALLLVAVPFGMLLDQVVRDGPLVELDTAAANHLHGWVRETPWLVNVLQGISFLGSPLWFYGVGAIVVAYLWSLKRIRLIAFFICTTIGGGIVDSIVKIVVDRDRPSLQDPVATAHGQSFPSGHSMTSVVAYGALLLIFLPALQKRWRMPAVAAGALLCLAIGFTRLALGVHFISDVLGGFALGIAWLVASVAAFSIWRQERGRKPVQPARGVEPEAAKDLRPSG